MPELTYSLQQNTVTSDLAKKMLDKAEEKGKELGMKFAISIVDKAGNLKAFSAMDGAPV